MARKLFFFLLSAYTQNLENCLLLFARILATKVLKKIAHSSVDFHFSILLFWVTQTERKNLFGGLLFVGFQILLMSKLLWEEIFG